MARDGVGIRLGLLKGELDTRELFLTWLYDEDCLRANCVGSLRKLGFGMSSEVRRESCLDILRGFVEAAGLRVRVGSRGVLRNVSRRGVAWGDFDEGIIMGAGGEKGSEVKRNDADCLKVT